QVPDVVQQTGAPPSSGMMAYFQSSTTGNGTIVLYVDEIAQAGKYMAIASVVHEMRHAAQYQLVAANRGLFSALDPGQKPLASAYAAAWQAMDALGGESSLAYGDYAHLNVEYDAFQTGNEVASILSNGQFDASGFGFLDTHYDGSGTVGLDLSNLGQ